MRVEPTARAAASVQTPSAAATHAAQAFEQLLVEQLAQFLVPADDGSGGDGASSPLLSQLLPETLARSVTAGGGLGLAPQLARELDGGAS